MGTGKTGINAQTYAQGGLQTSPIWSAATQYTNVKLRLFTASLLAGFIAALVFAPARSLQIFGLILSGFITAMAALRYLACTLAMDRKLPNYPDPQTWPFYTVLVPMRDEAHMVPNLMASLASLDYPAARLEIFMISEADDPATTEAVLNRLRPPFKSIVVPSSLPATKPKALNVAMAQAKGEITSLPCIWTNKRHLSWDQCPYLLSTILV